MPTQPRWRPYVLYSFLIGNRDRESRELPEETLEHALYRLENRLVEVFGGRLRCGPRQAEGETKQWGKEGTTLYFALCPVSEERSADKVAEEEAAALLTALAQDEVWIAKDEWKLFVARRPAT